jgi:hypothetical protein
MQIIKKIGLGLLFMGITACSSSGYQHSAAMDDKAYLALKGDPDGIRLVVDGQSVDVGSRDVKTYELDGIDITRFVVGKGQHHVQVYRADRLIINRKIFVTPGHLFELEM